VRIAWVLRDIGVSSAAGGLRGREWLKLVPRGVQFPVIAGLLVRIRGAKDLE
jgi:hypothetical protein